MTVFPILAILAIRILLYQLRKLFPCAGIIERQCSHIRYRPFSKWLHRGILSTSIGLHNGQINRRNRLHEGGQDHPELHRRCGQIRLEEVKRG